MLIIVLLSSRAVSVLRRKRKRSVVPNEQNMTVSGKREILETIYDQIQVGMQWKYPTLPSVISNPAKFDTRGGTPYI